MPHPKAARSRGSAFGPAFDPEGEGGLRPSVEALLARIDVAGPGWPAVSAALRELADAGVPLDEAAVETALKLAALRRSRAPVRPGPQRRGLVCAADSIVYYVRRGSVIKIGTTIAPVSRFRDLLPDEILAVEPGGRDQESHRHRQFAHLRGAGEHFRPGSDLLAHVKVIRATYGAPDPAWPTSASARQERRRYPLVTAASLPAPRSPEMVTALEADMRLGIKRATVYQWVRRGRITPAGKDAGGSNLFYADHLTYLRDLAGHDAA